jgi:predicted nucleotidyltransferase
MTTLEHLQRLVYELEQARKLVRLIDRERSVEESTETTLVRIIRERQQAQRLVEAVGFPAASFDSYRRTSTLESNLKEMTNEATNRREQKLREATQED